MAIIRQQIEEDLEYLKKDLSYLDPKINKDEYAFNYWILVYLYNLGEEVCSNYITDGAGDKGIDCFVHFEENKELYIIQNKYYSEETKLDRKDVADFLTTPPSALKAGNYKHSSELQGLYSKVKDDEEYTIYLHFYVSNDKKNQDAEAAIKKYNSDKTNELAELFYLEDIKNKRYGKFFSENKTLKTKLTTIDKGTSLEILPLKNDLKNMLEAYYLMVKIGQIYNLWKEAEDKRYPLFEKNIREYLGNRGKVNRRIIKTLENPQQRRNFFYYNNGITMICDEIPQKSTTQDGREFTIINPQIINGCQTVNSIARVLKKNLKSIDEDYSEVYVLVKVLVLKKENEEDKKFYTDIVKYTNSQNAINEKVFGAIRQPFFVIQKDLKKLGILLLVKQSDKNQFETQEYKPKSKEQHKIIEKARKFSQLKSTKDSLYFFDFNTLPSLQIKLEKLLLAIAAFCEDAHYAYTKTQYILEPSSKYYQDFSAKVGDRFSLEAIGKIVLVFKKANQDVRNKDLKYKPYPYYLLNFIGHYLKSNEIDLQRFLKEISIGDLSIIYDNFKTFPGEYVDKSKELHGYEYLKLTKQKTDLKLIDEIVSEHLNGMKKHNPEKHKQLTQIFSKST